VGDQCHAPTFLPQGKSQYPLYRRMGGPQGRSGRVQKILPEPGFAPRTIQPVASSYTDFDIPGKQPYPIVSTSSSFTQKVSENHKKPPLNVRLAYCIHFDASSSFIASFNNHTIHYKCIIRIYTIITPTNAYKFINISVCTQ